MTGEKKINCRCQTINVAENRSFVPELLRGRIGVLAHRLAAVIHSGQDSGNTEKAEVS
jgi:hypothetical protein